jgi:hypothetical protein
MKTKPVQALSDDELFDEIREQVNRARHHGGHNRGRTRQLAEEAHSRGWNLGRPKKPKDPK